MKLLNLQVGKSLVQGAYSSSFFFKSGCILSQQFELGIPICLIALQTLQSRPPASESSALTKEKWLLSIRMFTVKIYKNKESFSQCLRKRGNIVQEFLGFFSTKYPFINRYLTCNSLCTGGKKNLKTSVLFHKTLLLLFLRSSFRVSPVLRFDFLLKYHRIYY